MGRAGGVVTPTLRALPTAYDPADGPATVATPSCCCCCCCCLVTVGGVVGFTVAETVYRAGEDPAPTQHRRRVAAVVLALAGLPAAVLVALGMQRWAVTDDGVALPAIATYLLVTTFGFRLAGARLDRALGLAAVVGAVGVVAFIIEIPLALVTFLVLELAAPGGVVLGCLIARSRHRTRIANRPASPPRPRPGTSLPPPW